MTISFAAQALIKYALIVIIMVHWSACFWHMIGDNKDSAANWIVGVGQKDASNWTRYTTAFYWATMTLTTIGYGDVGAQNTTEQWVATAVMLLGGGMYAYVVGGICEVFTAMNPEKTDFMNAMDTLNALMRERYGRRRGFCSASLTAVRCCCEDELAAGLPHVLPPRDRPRPPSRSA